MVWKITSTKKTSEVSHRHCTVVFICYKNKMLKSSQTIAHLESEIRMSFYDTEYDLDKHGVRFTEENSHLFEFGSRIQVTVKHTTDREGSPPLVHFESYIGIRVSTPNGHEDERLFIFDYRKLRSFSGEFYVKKIL